MRSFSPIGAATAEPSHNSHDDARGLWIRLVLGLSGLRGIVAFPGADERLVERAAAVGIKTWRPYG